MANINKVASQLMKKIENELYIVIGREELYLPYWEVGKEAIHHNKKNRIEIKKTDSDSYQYTFSYKQFDSVTGCFNLNGGLKVTSIFI